MTNYIKKGKGEAGLTSVTVNYLITTSLWLLNYNIFIINYIKRAMYVMFISDNKSNSAILLLE